MENIVTIVDEMPPTPKDLQGHRYIYRDEYDISVKAVGVGVWTDELHEGITAIVYDSDRDEAAIMHVDSPATGLPAMSAKDVLTDLMAELTGLMEYDVNDHPYSAALFYEAGDTESAKAIEGLIIENFIPLMTEPIEVKSRSSVLFFESGKGAKLYLKGN